MLGKKRYHKFQVRKLLQAFKTVNTEKVEDRDFMVVIVLGHKA